MILTKTKQVIGVIRCFSNRSNISREITLTDNCVKRLRRIKDNSNHLRVTVEGGGCAGFKYIFNLDNNISTDDEVFEKDDVKVIIDVRSLEYIKGSTIDYEENLIHSKFKIINNPLAEEGCSCGSSFSYKIK